MTADQQALIVSDSMSRPTFTYNVHVHVDCFVGIISRVNTALGTLRRAQAGMIAEKRCEGFLSLRQEMHSWSHSLLRAAVLL